MKNDTAFDSAESRDKALSTANSDNGIWFDGVHITNPDLVKEVEQFLDDQYKLGNLTRSYPWRKPDDLTRYPRNDSILPQLEIVGE